MAAESTEFELVLPEGMVFAQRVAMVVVPGSEGDLGVLPRHAPTIAHLRPGVISVYERRSDVSARYFVSRGFVEITPDRCTVLADSATPLEEIDRAATEQRLKDAGEDLADAKDDAGRTAARREITVAKEMLRALQRP